MESLVTSPASPNGLPHDGLPVMDPAIVVDYLASVLSITLGASRPDLESSGNLLSKAAYSNTLSRCNQFLQEGKFLYVQKDIASDTGLDGSSTISLVLKFMAPTNRI
jgi:dynein heavy chain 1